MRSSSTKQEYKNFEKEIFLIQEMENLRSQDAAIPSMKGISHITKANNEFKLFFDGLFRYPEDGILNVDVKGISYRIKSVDFDKSLWGPFHDISCKHTFDIDGISRGSIEDSSEFRIFFFDTSKRSNQFHCKMESPKDDDAIPWAFDCVRVMLNTARYDIVQHKQDDISYIIIENLDPVSLENFQKDSYAIQKAVGFLCGYMPGGEHYIFSGEDFQYTRLARQPLKSIYYPVTSNPYSFSQLHRHEDIVKCYAKLLAPIPSAVVSTLASQVRNNEELSVAILFLMEVSHMKSVVSMPGVFSVLLESFANIIINPLLIRAKLIRDEELAEQILKDLNAVIDKHASGIDTEALAKIKRRVTALNQPINTQRITNAMKLREPFDQLGIALSALDEKAIDFRNDLLHGNILMDDGKDRTSKEVDDHMLYISAKLYTLISKLILKNAGYNGYVINHAKFHDQQSAKNEPEYFELI